MRKSIPIKFLIGVYHWLSLKLFYLNLELRGVVRYDKLTNTYIRKVRGHDFHLNPKDQGISKILARDGIREAESVDALYKLLNKDMTILDLGANIGFYVVLESQIIKEGTGRIIAIEPSTENIHLLNINIQASKYQEKVKVFHGAISDQTGTIDLEVSPLSNCSRLAKLSEQTAIQLTVPVPSYTFFDFLKHVDIDFDDLDFLRMDVEGAEYIIFEEILGALRSKANFLIFVEFHPSEHNLQKHITVLKELEAMGFLALSVTKEYVVDGKVMRKHMPEAVLSDLYTDEFFTQRGGLEVFLQKGAGN